jgi:hypothetical protein
MPGGKNPEADFCNRLLNVKVNKPADGLETKSPSRNTNQVTVVRLQTIMNSCNLKSTNPETGSSLPQAVYYSLRCFLLERREMANAAKNTGVPPRGSLNPQTSHASDSNLIYQSPSADQSSQPASGLPTKSGSGPVVKQEEDGASGHGGDPSQGGGSAQGGDSSQGPEAAALPKGSLAHAAKAAFDLAKEVMEKLR